MNRLLTRPRTSILIAVTLLAAAATIALRQAFAGPEAAMQAAGGYGIVDYELGFTADRAQAMLDAWGSEGQAAARRSLVVDYAFMPAYGLAFAGITLLIARGQTGRLLSAGLALTLAPIAAALFDAVENVMLLLMLGQENVGAILPLVAGVCASVKFLLLIAALVYWVVGAAAWAIRRLTAR